MRLPDAANVMPQKRASPSISIGLSVDLALSRGFVGTNPAASFNFLSSGQQAASQSLAIRAPATPYRVWLV